MPRLITPRSLSRKLVAPKDAEAVSTGSADAMIKFRVLGILALQNDNRAELDSVLSRPKLIALLSYLAIATPRGRHRRDTLLALLWPEMDEQSARHALRQALYALRRALGAGALLNRGTEEIGLVEGSVQCDAVDFEAKLNAGEATEAMEIYQGDLLTAFHAPEAPEFGEWLDTERSRLRHRAFEGAVGLAEEREQCGELRDAIKWARQAVTFSPSDEATARRLIQLLDRAGDRAGALAEYETLARRLRDEYQVTPCPETVAAIEAIRNRTLRNGDPTPTSSDTASDGPSPLPPTPRESSLERSDHAPARSKQRHRARRLRVMVTAVPLVAAFAALWAVEPWKRPELQRDRVVVAMFDNRTIDPALDDLGRMATDHVVRGLVLTGFITVFPAGNPLLVVDSMDAGPETLDKLASLRQIASDNGAGTIVRGAVYESRDSLRFEAQVVDTQSRRVLGVIEPVTGAKDEPSVLIERVQDKVKAMVAAIVDDRVASWIEYTSRPNTYEAYLELSTALDLHIAQHKHTEGGEHFLRAAESDSTFLTAKVWAIQALRLGGKRSVADSLIEDLTSVRHRMAPLDRYFFDVVATTDPQVKLRALRRIIEIAPGTDYLKLGGIAALALNRPHEALQFLLQADPTSGWLRYWYPYWGDLTLAHHLLGDHDSELQAAYRGRELHPGPPPEEPGMIFGNLWYLPRALAALGRADELLTVLRSYADGGAKAYMMGLAATELLWHGHAAALQRFLPRAIAWHESQPSEVRRSALYVASYGRLLMATGRAAEAQTWLEQLRAAPNETVDARYAKPTLHKLHAIATTMAGDSVKLQPLVEAFEARYSPRSVAWMRAEVAAAMQQSDTAVAYMEKAFSLGYNWKRLHLSPALHMLRDYPPFQELVRPKR